MTKVALRRTTIALLAGTVSMAPGAPGATAQSVPSPAASAAVPGARPMSPGVWTRVEGRVEWISPAGVVRLRTPGGGSAMVDVTTVAPDAARLLHAGREVSAFGLVRDDGVLAARGLTVDYESPSPAASPPSR